MNPASIIAATTAPKAQCPAVKPDEKPSLPAQVDFPGGLFQPILAALNSGVSFENLRAGLAQVASPYVKRQAGTWVPEFYSNALSARDLTGDTVPEILFTNHEGLALYTCQYGRYIQALDRPGSSGILNIDDLGIRDLNGDRIPEIYYQALDWMPINGEYHLYVYEWDGFRFRNLLELNREDYLESNYPGAYNHGTFSQMSLRSNKKTGTLDLVIRGEVMCNPCFTAGPWREFTDVFTWNGSSFLHLSRQLDPPIYRFQAVQDGDLETWRGNYALALKFYQQATENQQLKGWSEALYDQQNDNEAAAGALPPQPTPTPFQPDPNEYKILTTYIHYRTMLIQAALGDFDKAQAEYAAFQQKTSPDQPGYDYFNLATTFWDAYQKTHDLSLACLQARQYATDHSDTIFTPIDYTWHGWQSPGYTGNPSDEQLICPFE